MVTPAELEVFQTCPALWKLTRQDGGFAAHIESDYILALKKTLFRMYAWRMSNDKPMRYESVREQWDKNWWANKLDEGDQNQAELMDMAAKGWMWLEKYWGEIYIQETNLHPISINFEFSLYQNELHHRIHVDLLLADNDQRITVVNFSERKTEWALYNSLATKAQIVALTTGLTIPPVKMLYYDLTAKDIKFKNLNISPKYLREAQKVVGHVSQMIRNEAIYTSPSRHCSSCPYKGKCWF